MLVFSNGLGLLISEVFSRPVNSVILWFCGVKQSNLGWISWSLDEITAHRGIDCPLTPTKCSSGRSQRYITHLICNEEKEQLTKHCELSKSEWVKEPEQCGRKQTLLHKPFFGHIRSWILMQVADYLNIWAGWVCKLSFSPMSHTFSLYLFSCLCFKITIFPPLCVWNQHFVTAFNHT